MDRDPMHAGDESSSSARRDPLAPLLAAIASPDAAMAARARDDLIALAAERMRALAHRMLARSARVRRWEETDDVVQGALLRLHRALAAVAPSDAQHFLRLSALQVRRELIDLSRRHGHAGSMAANHDTNAGADTSARQHVDLAADTGTGTEKLAEWTRFHEVVESLPGDQRELFEMVWYLGLSQDDIAAALDCSSRTVRRRWEETKRRFINAFAGGLPE
jgi:RNA polymerase sigma factor (sigma-70 family)